MLRYGYLGVGLGGAMTFMSTCTHTSCYVIVMFSCTCTHTSCYVMVILGWGGVGQWRSCQLAHTHVMLRYGYVGVGLGGVGWGNDVHVNLHTHVMLRYCYVLLHLHTHVMLRYGYLGVGLGGVGWGNDVHVNLHTHVMHTDYIPKSFPRRLYHGVNTKEHPELEKFVLGYCWRKSLGPLTPHRFLEELCKGVKAMNEALLRRRKKVLHPKKTRTYVKKRSSFGDFQNPIFHVNMKKMTFRCSENDIFVDEKLLKPYGRLWVGNQVVDCLNSLNDDKHFKKWKTETTTCWKKMASEKKKNLPQYRPTPAIPLGQNYFGKLDTILIGILHYHYSQSRLD